MNSIRKIINFISHRHYGFISPSVKTLPFDSLCKEDRNYVSDFESLFAEGVGNGSCVSFGAGRMAFYAILKCIGVKKGDEVILTGFTCSVMANAVFRIGADVKYCDIDQDTLGMSPSCLKKIISPKTKVVVAQHSFGIPCKIDEIKSICKDNNIFLIEDCALSYMSKYKGIYVGDYGDAAIFSTDHTKPINTLIGGLAYSKDSSLIERLRTLQKSADSFETRHVRNIIKRYNIEHSLMRFPNFNWYILMIYWEALVGKVLHKSSLIYLSGNTTPFAEEDLYSYPSKLPKQLAQIGISVIQQYRSSLEERRSILKEFVEKFKHRRIPSAYLSNDFDIIPLRLVYFANDEDLSVKHHLCGVWFEKPIINTVCSLKDFNYNNDCPISEYVGGTIINLPVLFPIKERENLYQKVSLSNHRS